MVIRGKYSVHGNVRKMNETETRGRTDVLDWFVVQGNDLKRPLIENAGRLQPEEARKIQLLFNWVESYLAHDGYDATLQRLRERGLSRKHGEILLGEEIRTRLPREEDVDEFVDTLPEDREGVEVL